DKDRGLGTGEFDETLGVDVSKVLIGSLSGYVELAYTFIGEPPGTTLHNSFGWSVGAAYAIAQPFAIFAFLDGATALPGADRLPGAYRRTVAGSSRAGSTTMDPTRMTGRPR